MSFCAILITYRANKYFAIWYKIDLERWMSMRIIICDNYEEMSKKAALVVASQINMKPDCVLGLATGSTPEGMYRNLVEMHNNGDIDFSLVTSFNLDEYYPIAKKNVQSYDYFMKDKLFSHINISPEKTNIPNGEAQDADKECADYEKLIEASGGIDLQILGIGQNGHIGFNEPDEFLYSHTHKTSLTESTINANARFFASAEEVPKNALTMGMATILKSKKILLLASGKNKHDAVKKILSGKITTSCPATMLNIHSDLVIICDNEAYNG